MSFSRYSLVLAGLLGFAAGAVNAEQAAPADIVISSGIEGGGYWSTADRMALMATAQGVTAENRVSTGSVANLRELMNGGSPVNIAFAQADALQYFYSNQPAAEDEFEVIGSIGEECVFIIADADGKLRDDKDLQEAPRLHLGIKSPNSGIRVTFDYMTSVVPEMKDITVVYGDAVDMMNTFDHPLSDIERAVMVVNKPGTASPELEMVIDRPDEFRFIKLEDKRFFEPDADGDIVYHSRKARPGVRGTRSVPTLCVKGLVLANPAKLEDAPLAVVADLVANHWDEVRAN